MYRLFGVPTLEQATYSLLCEKYGFSKFNPAMQSNCPCGLLIFIAKAKCTGNCSRLNVKGKSMGIIGMRGISTSSPLHFPLIIDG